MFSLSVKDVKSILQIEDTQHDDYIETMLPIIISFTEQYCNDIFTVRTMNGSYYKDQSGYQLVDMGIMIAIAKVIEFYMLKSGVSGEGVSRVSYSYSTELPKSILDILNQYRKVKFV